ncbi:MAG: hypothetical protein RLZZ463_1267, partial [Bacteroidota bacterium]
MGSGDHHPSEQWALGRRVGKFSRDDVVGAQVRAHPRAIAFKRGVAWVLSFWTTFWPVLYHPGHMAFK